MPATLDAAAAATADARLGGRPARPPPEGPEVPSSKSRKAGEQHTVAKRRDAAAEQRVATRKASLESPGWVAPLFITVGLLGVAWLVLYYIASAYIPFMAALGPWNVAIGMGLMIVAFAISTQWK